MSVLRDIVHTTVYRSNALVMVGEHRVMFRPRDSHDQRVLAIDLEVSPRSEIGLIQEAYSSFIALVQATQAATEPRFVCSFSIDQVPGGLTPPWVALAGYLPSDYPLDERMDFEPYLRPCHGVTHAWLQVYLPGAGWIIYDPTNSLIGGGELMRVAVVRDPGVFSASPGQLVRRGDGQRRHDRRRAGQPPENGTAGLTHRSARANDTTCNSTGVPLRHGQDQTHIRRQAFRRRHATQSGRRLRWRAGFQCAD